VLHHALPERPVTASLAAQLTAAAAHLAVEVKPAGAGLVRIGSARPKDAYCEPVLAPVRITIGDLAVVTVTPAANPRQEKHQTLDAERSSLLTAMGVASAAEAHALLARRREFEAVCKGIVAELKVLKVTDDPESAIAKLKASLAETEAAIEAALTATQRKRLPTTKEIEEDTLALGQERTQLDARHASLDELRAQQQEALEGAVAARSGTESKLDVSRP
jgi:hypothetical protein